MSKLGYTIKKQAVVQIQKTYTREILLLMTTHRLREICREEKIIDTIIDPLDKEELIRIILKYRSTDDNFLLKSYNQQSVSRLEGIFNQTSIQKIDSTLSGCAKLVCYEGLAVEYFDNFTIDYREELVDTNAILFSGNELCAIFNLQSFDTNKKVLHITKTAEMVCRESSVMNYTLYCFDKHHSKLIYDLYTDKNKVEPKQLQVYPVEVLNFSMCSLLKQTMPLAIDFGTSNTTAGMYLDGHFFERLGNDPVKFSLKENDINYVQYAAQNELNAVVCPSVIGVLNIPANGRIEYVYGHDAKELANNAYIDESFSLFYDIKRWISDYEKDEELIDRLGNRTFVKRKFIIEKYLAYIITTAKQRFKCDIKTIHLTTPVKQKGLFIALFKEILKQYTFSSTIDEGVSVLYNTISTLMDKKEKGSYKALVIDCGGGTTDLSSLDFNISDQRVSYKVDIKTSYENGDTDFGGNNLTFRLMQLIKIAYVDELFDDCHLQRVFDSFNIDIYRSFDENGKDGIYKILDETYSACEPLIPTRFKTYEHKSRDAYYKVKNNYYYLFDLAEQMKISFYSNQKSLRVVLTPEEIIEIGVQTILTKKWKICIVEGNELTLVKDTPTVYFNIYDIENALTGDIYHIVKKFIEPMYDNDELLDYSIIKLTGQSCKVRIFKDALKEFVPGKIIEFRNNSKVANENELKLVCLDGAIKFLKDRKYGYANINVMGEETTLPYVLSAYTHTGDEIVLIDGFDSTLPIGRISRNYEDLTLKLTLKDTSNKERYKYSYDCYVDEFVPATYEEIHKKYPSHIRQDYVDDIVNDEVKFFVYADFSKWGFNVLPILRKADTLMIGKNQFYLFENEGWVTNFFDGMK